MRRADVFWKARLIIAASFTIFSRSRRRTSGRHGASCCYHDRRLNEGRKKHPATATATRALPPHTLVTTQFRLFIHGHTPLPANVVNIA
jgi:hypothetical protein